MNLKELKEIIEMFESSDIYEMEMERQGVRIKLRKGDSSRVEVSDAPFPAEKPDTAKKSDAKSGEGPNLAEIQSPIVGTFYSAPAPDAEPFVKEGDEVQEGDVVCIIEAMKIMNEIKAEVSGRVNKILAENGQAIEFGQPLFLIEAE